MSRPVVTLSAHGIERLRSGHPWVYRSDVRSSNAEPGDLVRVESERGRPIGVGFWSSTSQISLRFLGADNVLDERAMLADRLRAAIAFRDTLGIEGTAWRAVNAEADRLPGLIVDVYGEPPARVVVLQTLTQGMDRRLPVITELLVALLSPAGVLARNDPKVRRLEGLPEQVTVPYGEVPDSLEVRQGPVWYGVDLRHGQKTGLFLDQRENYDAAARYGRGRALDAFAYHGGFALRLAGTCASVAALDSSAPAVAQTRANAARNSLANVEAREVNVFDELRELELARERFDTIVLDPPAFAKARGSVPSALRGYHDINLRALRLLRPGGLLFTASCSYHVGRAEFLEMLRGAAADAGRRATLRAVTGQPIDHPEILTIPETGYLKGALVEVA